MCRASLKQLYVVSLCKAECLCWFSSIFLETFFVVIMVQDAYVITHVLSELERLHEWQRLKRREIIAKNKSYLLASSKSDFSSCFSFELSRQNMTLKEKKRKKK